MDLINLVFRSYLVLYVFMFINDILVYCKSENDQMNHLRIVFQVLKENQMFAKFSKCEFWLRSVTFLVT